MLKEQAPRIEEYIASQLDGSVTADRIEFVKFESSPSKVWSELTSEDFSTKIHFRVKTTEENYRKDGFRYVEQYGDIDYTIYLDEGDVIEFLNFMFPDQDAD